MGCIGFSCWSFMSHFWYSYCLSNYNKAAHKPAKRQHFSVIFASTLEPLITINASLFLFFFSKIVREFGAPAAVPSGLSGYGAIAGRHSRSN